MIYETESTHSQSLKSEVDELERRLKEARAKLNARDSEGSDPSVLERPIISNSQSSATQHFLLLLADSALPLGSFAFSGGLESYLAHARPSSFMTFLSLSLSSYVSTTLPFVLAAHRDPHDLICLDDYQDAAVMCTVGRRASVAQGRALLSLYERSFRAALTTGSSMTACHALDSFSTLLRSSPSASYAATDDLPPASAHLGPLFGAVARALGLSLHQTAYCYVLGHIKALLSAAVRASIFGPYQAQKLLASSAIQDGIKQAIDKEWSTKIEDAGQCIPIIDLWIGRHEMLYSRIFNS